MEILLKHLEKLR